jgi:hypothetical protein
VDPILVQVNGNLRGDTWAIHGRNDLTVRRKSNVGDKKIISIASLLDLVKKSEQG